MSTVTTIDKDLANCAYEINLISKEVAYRMLDLGKWCAKARDLHSQKRDGSFASWVEENCQVSLGYCYGAIRCYETFGDCNGCKIDVRAMLLLSSKGVPQEVRDTAIEMAQSGEPVTKAVAEKLLGKEPQNERSLGGVREQPDTEDLGDADDFDDEPEDPTDVIDEPARPAQAKPKESNVIGDAIRQVTMEAEFATENLADFQVAAVYEGVRLWMAADLEKRGIQ